MTGPAELQPEFEEEPLHPDVAAHIGHMAHVYEQDGEELEVPSPGNFPMLLHAYILNRFGKEARWINVEAYQKWLRDYEIGHFVTSALDAVYEKERESVIDPALQSTVFGGLETSTTHAIVIEEIKPHLPSGTDPSILYDPPFES